MVVQKNEDNVYDQHLLEVELQKQGIRTVRRTFEQLSCQLSSAVGCLKGGELVRRAGHVRVFLAMSAIASASPLIHGLIVQPAVWGALRFLTGFCFAVLYLVIESWLNDRATNENRGVIFSKKH